MPNEFPATEKVYPTAEHGMLSLLDMLDYFEKRGALRVSDLHLKVGAPPAYRIDGDLVKMKGPNVTEDMAKKLIFPFLSSGNMQKFQAHHSVDCSYRMGSLQFRINVFMENDGLAAAIRALSLDIPKIEDIGFPNNIWEDIVARKHGLVLMTGITGAGKSTTIAALIHKISQNSACRIMTVEDPIEYIFPQHYSIISQREIGRDVSSFHGGLKEMLRQDPDVIFVGEMRDAETISMTLMAAETGHLVFSTLHTRDTTGTVTRILDYFPEGRQSEVQNQLSLGLAYIISQKLIPKKSGDGRIVAMEILNNNYACANLIRTGKIEQIYSQLQTKTRNKPDEKMITMEKHLSNLVKADKIDLLEAKKWANNLNTFVDCMQRD
ncbi:MAG: PilT/PilU family type 4a pilus ATPase [Sedimentisphaerales bacterium]|nr:PilT/PilU family type 4a pilus ATPase [Sedimentisphaerales bacterium]